MDFRRRFEKIKSLVEKYEISDFVETGTYLCYMIDEMLPIVDRVWSIELDQVLYEKAVEKYKDVPRAKLFFGDSGIKLGQMLSSVDDLKHSLLFLDAHFSEGITARGPDDTPLKRELIHVFDHKPKVVIVDDRWCFGNRIDWPTEQELLDSFVKEGYECSIYENILVAVLVNKK